MRHLNVGRPENQRRDLVIVAALLIASWVLAGLEPSGSLDLTRILRGSVLAPFIAADAAFEDRAALARRVKELESERNRLYRDLQESASLRDENVDLRELLDLPVRLSGSYVIAELIPGRPTVGFSHAFLLRSRRLGDLESPAGVSVPDGLVGVLRSTGGDTGLGDFWTHPDFRVSIRVPGGDATGIVRAIQTEDGETLMLAEGVPYQTQIPAGTALETTGLGGVFASGIRVGTVISEAASRSGWSRSFLVSPAVRPGSVRAVTVWRRPDPETRSESSPEPSAEGP